LEESGGTSIPPGFEAINTVMSRLSQKEEAHKSHHELTGKRQTRSQMKQKRDYDLRSQKNLSWFSAENMSMEDSPQASKSSKTTDSLAKLAKESLDVGKLLGIKAIDEEGVALKRITSSFKMQEKNV